MPVSTRSIMKLKWKESCQVEHSQDESIVTLGPKYGDTKSKTKTYQEGPSLLSSMRTASHIQADCKRKTNLGLQYPQFIFPIPPNAFITPLD